jgi:phospholipid N-methyltransferase
VPPAAGPRPSGREDREAAFKFFRQWLREPRSIAALAPSGRELARHVAAAVGRDARSVIELGGGTGVITEALLARGIAPERLLVLERNPALHAHLEARFPGVEVARADAFDLVEVVRASRAVEVGGVDGVASGLGLLNMAREDQRRLLAAAFAVLRPAGRFVQFTYAPTSPVPRELRDEFDLDARRASWSLRNLPPAFVYVLRRRRRS